MKGLVYLENFKYKVKHSCEIHALHAKVCNAILASVKVWLGKSPPRNAGQPMRVSVVQMVLNWVSEWFDSHPGSLLCTLWLEVFENSVILFRSNKYNIFLCSVRLRQPSILLTGNKPSTYKVEMSNIRPAGRMQPLEAISPSPIIIGLFQNNWTFFYL